MSDRAVPVPASTRNLTRVIVLTAVVGVVVGVAASAADAPAVLLLALVWFAGVAAWVVPGQRQVTVAGDLVEVRRTPGARPEARVARSGLVLERRGALFSWWSVADRRYSTPTARSGPLFALVDEQG